MFKLPQIKSSKMRANAAGVFSLKNLAEFLVIIMKINQRA